jgi:MFS family permease
MAPESFIALTFIVDMAAWLIVVFPTGWLADRYGWKPLLIMAWLLLAVRNGMLSVATQHWELIVLKILDGIANGMFAVLAASWVVKWLGDRNGSAEAHAIVGVSLVLGSALGTLASGLSVEWLGYRDLFAALAVAALIATVVLLRVPEIRDAKVSK